MRGIGVFRHAAIDRRRRCQVAVCIVGIALRRAVAERFPGHFSGSVVGVLDRRARRLDFLRQLALRVIDLLRACRTCLGNARYLPCGVVRIRCGVAVLIGDRAQFGRARDIRLGDRMAEWVGISCRVSIGIVCIGVGLPRHIRDRQGLPVGIALDGVGVAARIG